MKEKILLLEDDQSFGYILTEYLNMHDFEVEWAQSAETAIISLQKSSFSLAILDIMLPKMDGFQFADQLKKIDPQLPFIFLSAKSLKIDQLKGFKLGAYDYINKPIDEELLLAKIKAILKSNQRETHEEELYTIGSYRFSPSLYKLEHDEETIQLTDRETALLKMLCEHKNQLLSRSKTLHELWGKNDEFNRKSMDVFISHLRKYLSKDQSIKIDNIHGKGFIMKF